MNLNEYEKLARRTLKPLPLESHMLHMSMGLVGEIGELLDAVKKHLIYGKELDATNVTEEIGDCFYYVVGMCEDLGVDLTGWSPKLVDIGRGGNQGLILLTASNRCSSICIELLESLDNTESSKQHRLKLVDYLLDLMYILCTVFQKDPQEVFKLNINKLSARYGDKYSDYNAIHRDLVAERAVLQEGQ